MALTSFCKQLTADWQLGNLIDHPKPVSGGYMHRMYRLDTTCGSYAVKLLNPGVMSRPEAMGNYQRAEKLETVLEQNRLAIVAAMIRNGQKMQCINGQYYYLFPWVDSVALKWQDIRVEHCTVIGGLLGRMHSLAVPETGMGISCEPVHLAPMAFDWAALADKADVSCHEIYQSLAESLPMLEEAQRAYNRAVEVLPPMCCICNADMDCKNVLWQNGQPLVIDLECLEIGNPVNDLIQLSLSWAGGVLCDIDPARLSAFLCAYRQHSRLPALDWSSISGIGFSWLDWLAYNLRRACGEECGDEAERLVGVQQVRETLNRIRYYASVQEQVAAAITATMA